MAMALWLGAFPSVDTSFVLNYLVNDVLITNKVHPTTGILGWKFLLEVLTQNAVSDVGLQLSLQTTYPSMGYMIQGVENMEPATTIWELWNSDSNNPSMNSRNHIMFGSIGSWMYKTLLGIMPAPADTSVPRGTGYDHVTVGPDAYIVNAFGTTYASGRVTTPHGILQVQWGILPPLVSTCVSTDSEGFTVRFDCGSTDNTITGFSYAFYGTPTGDCNNGFKKGTCDAPNAKSIVEKACIGQSSCTFLVSNDFFGGDPCLGVEKHFDGQITCSKPPRIITKYLLSVVVPVGTTADVLIPIVPSLKQTPQNLVISEGSANDVILWSNRMYLPGVSGVSGAVQNTMGTAVIVSVSSGSYSFYSYGNE